MKQAEIWYADLNPVKGSEQAGMRPVVIVSGNMLNQLLPVCIVIPLTTKIKRYKGNPIITPTKQNGLQTESELLVFHVRSISKDRLVRKVGSIESDELERALSTLNDILKY
ncbi:MAG: type II toxin-antitoxin system PemK/MazF family toxin [Cyclobacteriaceae bacterium]|nr:type II toxin-antitoxin system PemK/MazF family toxin [Cyclobacteriaceae bacterium]